MFVNAVILCQVTSTSDSTRKHNSPDLLSGTLLDSHWRNKGESESAIPRAPAQFPFWGAPTLLLQKNYIAFFRKICFLLNVQK